MEVISAEETLDLVEQARRGDEASFNALCRLYEKRLFRQAMLLCGDESMADDLTQDTMFEAWKSLGRYNGECRFFTWACSILIHCHRRSIRRRRPIAFSWLMGFERERAEIALVNDRDSTASPSELAEEEERGVVLRRCLERLPEKQRQVVYLRFYVDSSLDGIAAALGCSIGTVKSRLFNALDRLTRMNELKNLMK
ncbi:MAG TPA: sigma-70 family RNA polymerase sigma factor [Verrucomicrobiae bacterium]|nr:sigma-70 family RNA polymerase sigma factor [Verrucomicrobiae bacterium]